MALLSLLPLAFFWQAALRQGVFYFGDIFRLYYPQRAAYAQALRQGRLPLWSPDILSGYPLLAEGEMGAFYPLNLLLYRFLPLDMALNYSVILHFMIAGLAMYLFARSLRLSTFGSLMAGLTYTFSGFFIGHVDHLSIMAAAPWLPIAFTLAKQEDGKGKLENGRGRFFHSPLSILHFPSSILLCGLVLGVQFLAGHPQISLMTILALVAYALFRAFTGSTNLGGSQDPATGRRPLASARSGLEHSMGYSDLAASACDRRPNGAQTPLSSYLCTPLNLTKWRPFLALTLPVLGAVTLGLGLAAVQLLPTYELTRLSQRAGGLEPEFFTSFSWHPALLATLVYPFILGNPYPNVSVELAAYLGLLPLLLALMAPLLRRDREALFFSGLALLALFLAFGHWNPLYRLLLRVPVFNLFRVPARFLYLFTFASATLCGLAADELNPRLPRREEMDRLVWGAGGLLGMALAVAWGLINAAPSVEMLVAAWRILPGALLIGGGLLLVGAWRGRLERRLFMALALGLTVADLYAYSAVYGRTYNDTMPLSEFYARPRSLDFFAADRELYRVYTHEAIVPALSVMRESLYPNIALLHGVPSANGYFPLMPRWQAEYLRDLSPTRLNLLNVRYFLIPQLLPVDEETEFYDLEDPFAPSLVGRSVAIPPLSVAALQVESYTSHSADWPQGELVAEIVLKGRGGERVTLPLRVGVETAEWAYDRPDVRPEIAHQRPPVARTWPARSGFPPVEHPGQSYRARYDLPSGLTVNGLEIRPHRPRAFIRLDRIELIDEAGQRHLLAHLLGYGEHSLVYRSEDVAIYRNHDALPRAFVVHRARAVADDEEALAALDEASFSPREEVILTSGQELSVTPAGPDQVRIVSYEPERVVVEADLADEGVLVLLDSHYPGWRAWVDGVVERSHPVGRHPPSQGVLERGVSVQEVEIHRADILFRAVRLPAGQHRVVFAYEPLSFRVGAAISLITAIGLGIGWWGRNLLWTGGGKVVYNRGVDF
ncbi:MAG: YfhO family protein [Anaerolineae bacterium]